MGRVMSPEHGGISRGEVEMDGGLGEGARRWWEVRLWSWMRTTHPCRLRTVFE